MSAPSPPPHEQLRLDHFLKRSGLVGTGGQAKLVVQDGLVRVNGQVETRRRRKLAAGDIVEFDGNRLVAPDEPRPSAASPDC